MKKTFFKNLWREIYGNVGRFASIFAISALGVGFLAGLLATTPDMRLSADMYFDRENVMDVRVISTLGLTDSAIKAIEDTVNVKAVMPSYSLDALVSLPGGDTVVGRIHALPNDTSAENEQYINRVALKEGRLPQNDDECVVQISAFSGTDVTVGTVIEFSPDNKDLTEIVQTKPLKVVGLVDTAYYFSFQKEASSVGSGTVAIFLFTTAERFTSQVYTEAYLTLENAREYNSYDDDYTDYVKAQVEELEKLGLVHSALRTEEVRGDANDKLEEGKQTLEDEREKADAELLEAKVELNDAEKKILDGERALRKAQKDLIDGRATYNKAYTENRAMLAEKQAQLDKSSSDLDAQTALWQQSKAQVDAAYAQFLAQIPSDVPVELAPVPEELAASIKQVEGAKVQIDAGRTQLEQGRAALVSGKAEAERQFAEQKAVLDSGDAKIKTEAATLADGKIKYNDGVAEYENGKKEAEEQIAKAEDKIFDAEEEIKKIEDAEWFVLDRNANVSYVTYEQNAEKVAAIAKIFPIFFFLVAALVIVTTMTRMVDEQRTQIGTMKALGYSRSVIATKYIAYAALACISGSVAGILIGFKLFPTVIYNAYSMMYTLPPLHTPINPLIAGVAAAAAIICGVGATLAACWHELREAPAILMLPKAPPPGKRILFERITPLWKRMKFTQKVTARNLIRHKKRVLMTIIGVAGCTALLLTGFGLRDSISDIIGRQFGDIYKYNLMIGVENERVLERNKGIFDIVGDTSRVESHTSVSQEKATLLSGGRTKETVIYVPKNIDVFPKYISLQERVSKKPLPLTDGTAIVTEKMASTFDLKAGDSFTLENDGGKKAELIVGGVCENYVESYVYMTENTYNNAYGTLPQYTLMVARASDLSKESRDGISADLLKIDGVTNVNFTEDIKISFDDMLKNINYIVLVLIVSAGALAFIVLYNLTNINITERQRELATIKVLGFYDREVSAYIYRETIIMSLLGTACGLGIGIFLHRFVVVTAEVDMVMFGRSIYPMSFVYSAALTLFFSLLVNLAMNGKMKKIDMIESLKANE